MVRAPGAVRDYPAIAKQYAADVVSGKIAAGKSIRLQCKRFLDELTKAGMGLFPYRFDDDRAARPCRFIEKLPHTKGEWARQKKRLSLEPWQIWNIAVVFGWLHRDGPQKDTRRFRRWFLIVPRKNGKSAIAAGVGLYMLCADQEFGAEVYSGATNEKQAGEVFRPARLIVDRTKPLRDRFRIQLLAKTLLRPDDGSKFETIVGDPGDGQSPSCSIHDEYHEHSDDGQVDTMLTGMGARTQPLQFLITTAGENLAGPCYAMILEQRERLAGIGHNGGPPLDDDTFFAEYTLDEDDDWRTEKALRKANPNIGISVSLEYLLARQRDAISTPRKRGIFKTKHLNMWVAAKAAFFDIEKWRKCVDRTIPVRFAEAAELERFVGRRCIIGLDLASKIDIAAMEFLFPPIGSKATVDDPYIRLGRYFLPSKAVEDVSAYQGWDADGLLDVSASSDIIDFEEIEIALDQARDLFDVQTIAYDPAQATMLVNRMVKKGAPMLEFRQSVFTLSEPMKQLDAFTRAGHIAHAGCPVMEWEMNNVIASPDAMDNVRPRKPRNEAKIDNPVALIIAVGVALSGEEEEAMTTSPYDDPEFSMASA
ncbi:terminase [Sphingomonas sp. Leaf407]|uniref:terminase large subunit n=1 Tax=unclassified Sphingomonas TaxID=196159 RepID=UPI0006FA80CE|nr:MULTISPECIES: terminase TerL endonuclease subunit [unclassified Sphingomonas]KQN37016.1 terminase [Sphingomonas sp. Leaf42]KQT30443.1 terminase [Sphingomonas sp. Leaf407]